MVIQFRFKNFKSFRDDTVLDLSATRIKEFSDSVVKTGEEKLLPVAGIYGANASGKSNVLQAFRYMKDYVLESLTYGRNPGEKSINMMPPITPFLFDDKSEDEPSLFEVYFTEQDGGNTTTYNYGFTLSQQGVVEEWLNIKAPNSHKYKRVFYRNTAELEMPGLSQQEENMIRLSLSCGTLVVTLGATLKIEFAQKVRNWFGQIECVDFGNKFENVSVTSEMPTGFEDDESVRKNVVKYISAFDPSIVDFKVKFLYEEKGKNFYDVEAVHRKPGGDYVCIPFGEESAGTIKMFGLYQYLKDTLEGGRILFVDELDSHLHPLLVRDFLLSFINPQINKKHAQIVFTTHDSFQLSNQLLRRDEIWFTEKDTNGISTLYSLADFVDEDGLKIRKDESYEKNYLLGKYGAIPKLENFNIFMEA